MTSLPFVDEKASGQFFEDDQKVHLYGLDYDYVVHGGPNRIERDVFLEMPIPRRPFFRESNLEVGVLKEAKDLVGGVVLNKKGELLGQWSSFPDLSSSDIERSLYVVPSYVLQEAVEAYVQQMPLNSMGVEFHPLNWIEASEFGLSANMLTSLKGDGRPERWFAVNRLAPDTPASEVLRAGDIVLGVNGQLLNHFRLLEKCIRDDAKVTLDVLRQGAVIQVDVASVPLGDQSDTTVLYWGGALIHNVPWFTSMQTGAPREGAYVSRCSSGAPCSRDRLYPTRRIVSANQQPVNSVGDLIAILQDPELPNEVRLQAITTKGRPETLVLRRDDQYWKSEILQWNTATKEWNRQDLSMVSE